MSAAASKIVFAAIVVTAGCLVGACAPAGSPADRFAKDPAAVERGKMIFVGTCGAYCHSNKKDNRDAPYLFDCEWLHGGSETKIFTTISNGVPNTRMVAFGGKLPNGDDDIRNLVAFLQVNSRCAQ